MKQIAKNIDCMKYISSLDDNTFDIAIVDPPYGIGEDGKKNHSRGKGVTATKYTPKNWDKSRPSKKYFEELQRVSKHQIIWGGNYFADLLPSSSGWIVWDKVNGDSDFSDCELAWTSFNKGVRMVSYMWNGMLQGKSIKEGWVQQGNKKLNEKRIHPTQKPVKLYEWIYDKYVKEGWSILDTHLGSGSSRIAAYEKGFEFVGCELDKEYFDNQEKRFSIHTSQHKLF